MVTVEKMQQRSIVDAPLTDELFLDLRCQNFLIVGPQCQQTARVIVNQDKGDLGI